MSGTVYHAYDGIHCVADLDGDGNILRAYTWGAGVDNLLAVTLIDGAATNTLYAVTDPLGTVHALVDSGGTVAVSYTYDSWGNVLSVSGDQAVAAANRFTWQGREYSYATGLYSFRARWYDPAAGRWLSKDPIGLEGGLNLYEAFGNNPVCFRDPEGLIVYYSSGDGNHAVLIYTDCNKKTGYSKFGTEGANVDFPSSVFELFPCLRKALWADELIQGTWAHGNHLPGAIVIKMTKEEEKHLMKLISNYEPGHYSVWFNNCSTVIRRLLYESGYFSSPSIRGLPVTPNGLQKEIEMRNVIRAGAEIYKRYIQQ